MVIINCKLSGNVDNHPYGAMINPAKPVVMILMFIEVIENICARERKKTFLFKCSKKIFVWLRKFIISD
tara:strand:+ start:254 stop:460 length:207 start_codon:yes stop_codon:yes gene_type:complete